MPREKGAVHTFSEDLARFAQLNTEFLQENMAALSAEQIRFLWTHGIDWSEAFDASDMSKEQYRIEMKVLGSQVAHGVTPCRRYGHTLRVRSGHCVQCKPAVLAFTRRHSESAPIYVAYSESCEISKIGLSVDPESRVKALKQLCYGGASDWAIQQIFSCSKSGRVESRAHALLSKLATSGTYTHSSGETTSRETFACRPTLAIMAVEVAIAEVLAASDEP